MSKAKSLKVQNPRQMFHNILQTPDSEPRTPNLGAQTILLLFIVLFFPLSFPLNLFADQNIFDIEEIPDAQYRQPPQVTLSSQPTVREFVEVGLSNHKPLEIAQKELKLAERKLFEARRNFFPVLSGKASRSQGKTHTNPADPSTIANFRREEIGAELGQPIFQSGRLYYSQKQAKTQKEIAIVQISKISQEITFEIVKALYAFLSAKGSLNLRKNLQNESEKIIGMTREKKNIGLTSESEYLGSLSVENQIKYKTISQEKEVEIAKTRLSSILNLEQIPEDIPLTIDELFSKAIPNSLELKELVLKAMENRPEIKDALLTATFKEYGRKIARSEYLFKVDANGFLGKSGAAFKSEPLTLKDSYNVGIKGVLYFGGNSVSPLFSQDRTAPDLGSSSLTETQVESITVGILDSLTPGSNLSQAKIDEEKAKEAFRKIKKDILLEVKESFFNYQKAKVQMEFAKRELDYRKKELEIAQAKNSLHQIEATQFLQAVSNLTEAEVSLKEATAFYLTSLSAMEKAAGTIFY